MSCNAEKNRHADAEDGVYWVNPKGTPLLAYCDMNQRTELCTEAEAEHNGRTREGSNTAFTLRSILSIADRTCKLWAVRDTLEQFPFRPLYDHGQQFGTCEALGFKADGVLMSCKYGDNTGYTNCGFNVSQLYAWGNQCDGCMMLHDGVFTVYMKQGLIHASEVISSYDGSSFITCRIE